MTEATRFVHDIPVRPREPARTERPSRTCAVRGCRDAGDYRAPVSPHRVEDYQWLCLEHVRAHNNAWDFFRDMSESDVERYIRDNAIGHRPTWTLGEKTARPRKPSIFDAYRDPFHMFEDGMGFPHQARAAPGRHLTRLQRDALEALELAENASLNDVKARYKELVKRFHPDANDGDRSCEERLKKVIRAYRTLRATNFV